MPGPAIPITGDDDADRLLEREPLALLIGMLLDQQVPMEWAFRGPLTLQERLGRPLDAVDIADLDPDELDRIFREKPAMHRYPGSMATRTQELCRHVAEHHGGDAGAVWRDATDASDLLARVSALPGYGDQKARILVAILGKRLGVAPDGWEKVVRPYGDSRPRSVADVDAPGAVAAVRDFKQRQKKRKRAAAKASSR